MGTGIAEKKTDETEGCASSLGEGVKKGRRRIRLFWKKEPGWMSRSLETPQAGRFCGGTSVRTPEGAEKWAEETCVTAAGKCIRRLPRRL